MTVATPLLTLCAIACALVIAQFPTASLARPGSEKLLYNFTGKDNDGCYPAAPLVLALNGDFYGETLSCGGAGNGSIFQITAEGKETPLFGFGRGGYPESALIQDSDGTLYGVAGFLKPQAGHPPPGAKAGIFSLKLDGTFTLLALLPRSYGAVVSGVIADSAGDLYGLGQLAAFEVPLAGNVETIHRFHQGVAVGSLLLDKKGNLFGVTETGGNYNLGTIFEITKKRTEKVLYSFTGGADGGNPLASLIADRAGNLYGTTHGEGQKVNSAAFKFSSSGTLTVLHTFSNDKQGADGSMPAAALVMDRAGNLYGTTTSGGVHGHGTVYEISASGEESVLYAFGSQAHDGIDPKAPLVFGANDHLYGTTYMGGATGYGTVFEITP